MIVLTTTSIYDELADDGGFPYEFDESTMYEAGDHGRGRISFPHSTPPLHPPDFSTFSPPSVYAFPNVGATNDVLEKMLVNKNV